MKPTRKQYKKNPVSQMQKSPYEKARDENVRQRKELEKELNITNLSKRLDEAEVPDAEMSLLDDSNIDTDGDAIWGNKNLIRNK